MNNGMFVKDQVKCAIVVICDGTYVGTTKKISFEGEPSRESAMSLVKSYKDFIKEEINNWEYEFPNVKIVFKGIHYSFRDNKVHNDAPIADYTFEM